MTYTFLQEYWWFLVSLLAALFVVLMFVQGGQTLIWALGRTEPQRRMLLLATGRKWELTFTTLVTFGGAFFASFPLFYSTSFGGAYWVWMLILLCFVIQAVSYEFQLKRSNLLGTTTYRLFLMINGLLGPLLVGTAVGTFFFGANFIVDKQAIVLPGESPVISRWVHSWHGLEAVLDVRNVLLGLAVLMLSRCLAHLYFLNRIEDEEIRTRSRSMLPWEIGLFLIFFLSFAGFWLTSTGLAVASVSEAGAGVQEVPCRYLHALLDMPVVLALLLTGVILVLIGLFTPLVKPTSRCGIWSAGIGTTFTVLSLLLAAGWNGGTYYPSLADPSSSLTLANSCSSPYTLQIMSAVSLLIPFVLAYIIWAWHALEKSPIQPSEVDESH